VSLPAGTTLVVRTIDAVSSKNQAGTPFTTRLEYDLAGGLKAGTTITGKVQSSTQAGRVRGQSTLDLRLTQITVNGKQVPIVTSGYQQAGQKSIKKAAKGAAAGAAIGAIADDAGKGAAIGAVAGGAVKGQTVTVPPGTLLQFTLQQAVTL
jgi:YD repeat-containing protein